MPIYEYKCLECGYRFEKFQRLNEASPDFCPRCGGLIKKVLSAPAIHFKGSGWYVTDYARPNPSNSSRSKQEHASSPKKKSAVMEDKKPGKNKTASES